MKEIPLTQGKVALVDDEDYEMLIKYKWHAQGVHGLIYARRSQSLNDGHKNQITIRMHREILGIPKGFVCDHINGNTLDNRKENLRITDNRGNCQNRSKHRAGHPLGSCRKRNRVDNPYISSFRLNGKRIHLGVYQTAEEAQYVYSLACWLFCDTEVGVAARAVVFGG